MRFGTALELSGVGRVGAAWSVRTMPLGGVLADTDGSTVDAWNTVLLREGGLAAAGVVAALGNPASRYALLGSVRGRSIDLRMLTSSPLAVRVVNRTVQARAREIGLPELSWMPEVTTTR